MVTPLIEAFHKSVEAPESTPDSAASADYFSANANNQDILLAQASGNRAATNAATSTVVRSHNLDQQKGAEEDDAQMRDILHTMEQMRQEFEAQIEQAIEAGKDLKKAALRAQEKLDKFKAEIEQNTIVLSDGTAVYFDLES